MKKDLKTFSRFLFKWLMTKPHSKYQALAHIWDRAIVAGFGLAVSISAFLTNQAGILVVILVLAGMLFFGLYLVSRGR